ncbi:MAG: hypothetical protein ACXWJX_15895 [Limisphaerales bacterium]
MQTRNTQPTRAQQDSPRPPALARQQKLRQSRRASAKASAAHATPLVATARRVPWRRLQIYDVDDAIKVWTAPAHD